MYHQISIKEKKIVFYLNILDVSRWLEDIEMKAFDAVKGKIRIRKKKEKEKRNRIQDIV